MTFASSFSSSRIVSTLLWIGAFISSLYIINRWELGFYTASIGLLFIWAWVSLSEKSKEGWSIPLSPVLGFAAAFWALAFASVFWSELPLVSLSAFCFFSALPLTLFVFILNPDEKQFKIIAAVAALVFAALSVWAVIQYCSGYSRLGGQAHHPLGDPNALGGLFNLGLIPVIGWMLLTPDRRQSIAAFILAALIFAGMLATGSRGAFFSLIPALAIFAVFGWHYVRARIRMFGLLALVAAALFVASNYTGKYDWNTTAGRVAQTVMLENPDITNNRLNIWDGAIEVIKHHGLFGTGIGTFFLYYPEHRSPAEHVGASHAHSDPLEYWAEMGIASVVLFYGFLIAVLVRTWRALKKLAPADPLRIFVIAPVCALGAVVIQTHVSFNFYNLVILFGSGFLMAVWFFVTQRILGDKTRQLEFDAATGQRTRRFALALPFAFIFFLFGSYMMSEHYVNAARDSLFADEDLQAFAHNLQTAHAWDHGLNFRTWLLASNIPMGILQESRNTLDEKQRIELYEQAAGQLARAEALNPRSASVLYYRAKLQSLAPAGAVTKEETPPEDLYKRAITLDPLHLGARTALADIYEARGDNDAAMKVLDEGIDYTYSYSRALDYYGRVMLMHTMRGEKDMQQKAMNKMIEFKRRMKESALREERLKRREASPVGRDDVLR